MKSLAITEVVDVKRPNILSLGGKYKDEVITRLLLVENRIQIFTEKGFHEYPISDKMALKLSDGTFAEIKYNLE